MAKYTENQIEKIITSGGVRSKITLYLRDRMGYHGQGFILPSYDRAKELSQSVRPVDRMEWEERVSMGLRIENSFRDLQIILLKVEEMKRDLLRTLTEIQEFENLENLLNRTSLILGGYDYIFDDDLLEQFNFVRPDHLKSEGFSLGLTGENSLTEKALKEREELREQIQTYLCYERAVLNVVQDFKPEIPEYLDYLKENHRKLETPLSLPLRFRGTQDDSVPVGSTSTRIPFPALIDLLEDFSVKISEISIEDEDSLKTISDFEKTI